MPLRRVAPEPHGRIWGSKQLSPWFADEQFAEERAAAQGGLIGEVWFTAPDVPLLVKFIFTTGKLSVQVHPDDAYAGVHHNSPGKTEMWHVLAARPGARIAAGFRERLEREEVREAALSGRIEHMLAWIDARPGDTFFLPAGTVHAIGEGLVMCEIQQPSDLTYRLYDYGRLEGGRPRPLQLEDALAVGKFEPHDPRRPLPVRCDYFTAESLSAPCEYTAPRDRAELLIAILGNGRIGAEPLCAGEVLCVSPGAGSWTIEGDLRLLRAHV